MPESPSWVRQGMEESIGLARGPHTGAVLKGKVFAYRGLQEKTAGRVRDSTRLDGGSRSIEESLWVSKDSLAWLRSRAASVAA